MTRNPRSPRAGNRFGWGAASAAARTGFGLILIATLWTGSTVAAGSVPEASLRAHRAAPNGPRNIILFIGDGMGEVHRRAARWVQVGPDGELNMDGPPASGLSHTASANNPVTDSAAGATAIATGVRTDNYCVAVDPDGVPLTTILEHAHAQGKAAGLVTSVQISHATPAAFAAHVENRSQMTDIAAQMLEEGVEVLLGGGEDEFLPIGTAGHFMEDGERTDGRNLLDEVSEDYAIVWDTAGLALVDPVVTARVIGLFADEGMIRPYAPDLATMTQRAIDILSRDPQGFFLMVEGGQIDQAAHSNNGEDTIGDTLGFDQAVAVGKAYAASAGNTLVIVTADHETGGMGIVLGSACSSPNGPFAISGSSDTFCVTWTTGGHTAADVPVTASGPFAHLLAGSYDNTHIFEAMYRALVLDESLFLPLLLRH